ncbi:hypothetical protein IQ07DRAFT_96181 [Pyrenochaeta sp. DS3sAY3a]|nr:hypothetical protein IQ07DRAFT_96181 [Pyrenochaeta sp. DS3sAY3a]
MASDTDEATAGKTRPMIARGDIADASAYWSISPWGDGTWFMTNAANGTGYHLNREDGNGTLSIDPNITAPQNGQRWGFKEITEINDSRFSTVNLLGAVIATSSAPVSSITSSSSSISTTSTSSAPTTSTQTNPSSGGLSPAVQGAIGGAVGGVALIAFIVLGLFFWRRRRQRQFRPSHEVHEVHEAPSQSVKYTMYHESPVREIPVEAPGMTRDPAELPANTAGR